MIDVYRIRSPLSQITDERADGYTASLGKALGEELRRVSLDDYLRDDFALLYVASGGSERYFLEVFDALKGRECYILTSGESNSLAASMAPAGKMYEANEGTMKSANAPVTCAMKLTASIHRPCSPPEYM